ncbi:hypothetical protein LIER_17797 [Lithospermum erythrorhizon]|uniref:Reverse transcriptase domain-containing protein n=1 Tax=Lithospermum erythrorhizon TaxID=34254 RepID=A0AAV3QD02_LITER
MLENRTRVKTDMSKAFDRVKWDFLFKLVETVGFPEHWINLIKECVNTVVYSVIVNGQVSDTFKPSCGLRQRDPLSPIFFALYTEALSSSLQFHQDQGTLKGIGLARNGPKFTHLLFADDSYFFMHLDNKSLDSFRSKLSIFCYDSGQIVNQNKSIITFSPLYPQGC